MKNLFAMIFAAVVICIVMAAGAETLNESAVVYRATATTTTYNASPKVGEFVYLKGGIGGLLTSVRFQFYSTGAQTITFELFEACGSSTPIPGTLKSWNLPTGTGWHDCEAVFDPPVEIPNAVFAVVTQPVSPEGGWRIAGQPATIGYTPDQFGEDDGSGWLRDFWYGGSPYASFYLELEAITEPSTVIRAPFCQDFTDEPVGEMPEDWRRTHPNWTVNDSSVAGGEPPELRFFFFPEFAGVSRAYAEIDATGLNDLQLEFDHFVGDWDGGYTVSVQTSPDGNTWTDRWSLFNSGGNIGPDTVSINLNAVADQVFHLAFVFDGNTENLVAWYIDNICLFDPSGITLLPAYRNHSASPESDSFYVLTDGDWTAVANDGWITVTDGTPGNGTGTVSYSITHNPDATPRTGTITVSDSGGSKQAVFTVYQASGTDCINHGDVNLDGQITAADAQLAFFIVLGTHIPTFEEECAADCNGDGIVTAADAQAIFLTVLGSGTCVDPL